MPSGEEMVESHSESDAMTTELARSLFDRMSAEEPADFSVIERYYHPDVRFQDPIQEVVGRDAFIEMTERLVRRCKELRSKAHDVAQAGDVIFVQWEMEMRFGSAPLSKIEGVTRLRLDERGRVIEHRDYFDLWGDSLDGIPVIGNLYRRFTRLIG